MLTFFI